MNRRAHIRGLMTTFGKRIRKLRISAGMKQAEWADVLGVSQPTISNWEADKQDPERGPLIKLASYLGKDLSSLLIDLGLEHDITNASMQVPIVGYVGAGAEASIFDSGQGPFDYLPMPPWGTPVTVAVEIRGVSLGPMLNGWYAYYDDRRDPPTNDLLGQLCVVCLTNGQVLIKILSPGRKPGMFDCISPANGEIILDCDVEWAAKVTGLTPHKP